MYTTDFVTALHREIYAAGGLGSIKLVRYFSLYLGESIDVCYRYTYFLEILIDLDKDYQQTIL